jgi:hypothetical protein
MCRARARRRHRRPRARDTLHRIARFSAWGAPHSRDRCLPSSTPIPAGFSIEIRFSSRTVVWSDQSAQTAHCQQEAARTASASAAVSTESSFMFDESAQPARRQQDRPAGAAVIPGDVHNLDRDARHLSHPTNPFRASPKFRDFSSAPALAVTYHAWLHFWR